MKKVYCFFSANYLPNVGGVERYTYNLAKKLVQRGNRVIIVTSNVFLLKEYEEIEGIEIYRLPCYNWLNGRFPVLRFNKKFHILSAKLKKIPMDLIMVNTRFYLHSLYGVWLAKKKNTKCIVIEHGTSHLTVDNKVWDKIGEGFEHFFTKIIRHYCDKFYGVSKACNNWSAHFGIQSEGILYNAVNNEEIQNIRHRHIKDYREDYGVKHNELVIVFTGRLVKEKGILNLIEAVNQLNSESYPVHLFIAGAGNLEDFIKEKEMESVKIHFLGQLNFENVVTVLDQSDIFCLPSESEGFPTSTLEAAACECYVVSTDCGGTRELIINNEFGTIIKNNEVESIYKALKKVVLDKKIRERGVGKSYKYLINNFTWEKTAENVEKIMDA